MARKMIFNGKVIKVVAETRRLPNNCTVRLEVVEHRGAALILPLLAKDKVIVLKQFRPVINRYIYELPAGTLEVGETPYQCARREIKEETGYQADIALPKNISHVNGRQYPDLIHLCPLRQ